MRIIITIDLDDNGKVTNQKIETVEDATKIAVPAGGYHSLFGPQCSGWTKDPEYNKMFLQQQQVYANDRLRARGHLFLNDVYDMLGIARTKTGQVVGWVYTFENAIGDNFVDFGLRDSVKFKNENDEEHIMLEFNVDGNILDRI